jgi:hypothetical protein
MERRRFLAGTGAVLLKIFERLAGMTVGKGQ